MGSPYWCTSFQVRMYQWDVGMGFGSLQYIHASSVSADWGCEMLWLIFQQCAHSMTALKWSLSPSTCKGVNYLMQGVSCSDDRNTRYAYSCLISSTLCSLSLSCHFWNHWWTAVRSIRRDSWSFNDIILRTSPEKFDCGLHLQTYVIYIHHEE